MDDGTRFFDLQLTMKDGTEKMFSQIDKADFTRLNAFGIEENIRSHERRQKTIEQSSEPSSNVADDTDSDDEDFVIEANISCEDETVDDSDDSSERSDLSCDDDGDNNDDADEEELDEKGVEDECILDDAEATQSDSDVDDNE
ncbi:hypothetical protein AB6A40_006173 [Gnathostoma spinigerum]|uniref:Uncharacterized protein n=1 Tax=Gnathostoma spinigerum TaxID=75299 RepID=A0ABD6EMT8_9BILA